MLQPGICLLRQPLSIRGQARAGQGKGECRKRRVILRGEQVGEAPHVAAPCEQRWWGKGRQVWEAVGTK